MERRARTLLLSLLPVLGLLLASPAGAQEAFEADVSFPALGVEDAFTLDTPPTLWAQGDTITGVRPLDLARIDDAEVTLTLAQNQLQPREECTLLIDLKINDVPLGTLTVAPGDVSVSAFLVAPEDILAEDGDYRFRLSVPESVEDGCGSIVLDYDACFWHVERQEPAGNPRPRGTVGGPYEVPEGGTIVLHAEGSDPEGDEVTLSWDLDLDGEFDDGDGEDVEFDASTVDGPTEATARVRIADEGGAAREIDVPITVTNVAPYFDVTEVPRTCAAVGELYTYQPTVVEPSALDDIEFTLLRKPQDMTIGADGTLEWTPDGDNEGHAYTVELQVADDDGGETTLSWEIAVVENADGPCVFAGMDRTVDPGCIELSCNGSGGGAEGLKYHWELQRGPAEVVFRDQDAQNTVAVLSSAGDYTFECTATEDIPEDQSPATSPADRVVITVNNLPPIADPGFSTFGKTNQRVTLDGRRSIDPNGDGMRYRWEQTSGEAVRISGYSNPITSFYPLVTDIYCFQLTVQDALGVDGEPAEVCVVVNEPGDPETCEEDYDCIEGRCRAVAGEEFSRCEPFVGSDYNPIAWAGQDQRTLLGDEVQLNGLRSYDPDGGFLEEYRWTQTCGPADVQISGDGTMIPSFTPLHAGRYCFSLEVIDEDGHRSLPDTVEVLVETGDNLAPMARTAAGMIVQSGSEAVLDGSASRDPEGEPLTYHWTQVRGPEVQLDDPTAPVARFCAAIPGIYQFQLEVSDGATSSVPAEQWISVATDCNEAPVAKAGVDFKVFTDDGDEETLEDRAVLDGRQSYDPDPPPHLLDPQEGLRFQWVQIDGLPVDLQLPFTRRPWFRAPRWGIYRFRLFLLDSWPESENPNDDLPPECWESAWSVPDDVVVVVNDEPGAPAGNSVPEANAGEDIDCLVGEECALDGSLSVDADGDALSYRWVQTGGSPLALDGTDTSAPHFPAEEVGEWTFLLYVSDDYIESLPDEVKVRIRTFDNVPPICRAGHDTTVRSGTSVVLNGCGSLDANGDRLTYTWSQVSGDDVGLEQGMDADACKAYFDAPIVAEGTMEFTFELVANDSREDCEADQVTITVEPEESLCVPGEQKDCRCDDNTWGKKTCLDDGTGYGECTDCAVPKVCAYPGEESECYCDNGGLGTKVCNEDQTEWSDCSDCSAPPNDGDDDSGDDEGCAVAGHGQGSQGLVGLLALLGFTLLRRRR